MEKRALTRPDRTIIEFDYSTRVNIHPSVVIDVEDTTHELCYFFKSLMKKLSKCTKATSNKVPKSRPYAWKRQDDIPVKYKLFIAFGGLIEDSNQFLRLLTVPFFVYMVLYCINCVSM